MDSRGRTQYRYSADAVDRASRDKFEHMLAFATSLPVLRKRVSEDLEGEHLEASTVTATVVRLLDKGLFRVGNERYRRDNHTFGLTTLRRSQVALDGVSARFDFVGKEHKEHSVSVADSGATRVLRALLTQAEDASSPLFMITTATASRLIDSVTVNAYIHTHADTASSAKTFRTWGASVAAAAVSAGATVIASDGARHSPERLPLIAAAQLLGNTPAVAKQSYVHPAAIAVGRTASVRRALNDAAARAKTDDVRVIHADPSLQEAIVSELALVRP
ncbi:DNA topoisomerase IB [Protaetiibacter intestinalis]|uniref:DNA topoisomerase IB n=1 Tax=Protaetiibacter intestinalis TaxID=2419774 RepID=UPI0013006D56|nr:DNA topoisomerase IB [Protaetiibacter intestinalis]